MFYFYPYLGKIPILTNIFQMGWNHQPVEIAPTRFIRPFEEPFYLLTPPEEPCSRKNTEPDRNVSWPLILMGDGVWESEKKNKKETLNDTEKLTYILLIFDGKCRKIYHIHTLYLSVWENNNLKSTHTHTLRWRKHLLDIFQPTFLLVWVSRLSQADYTLVN